MSDVAMAAVQAYLKELRLPAFARLLPETLREAESQGRPFLDVLRVLLEGELAQRQINQGRRRIREARFPYAKDLAEFDFTANPTIKKSQILSLARGEYLAKRQNVIPSWATAEPGRPIWPSPWGGKPASKGTGCASTRQRGW